MKGRIWTAAVGLAAVAALIAVPAAMAAYMSPKLEVTQTATGVVVKASLDPNDDPTAAVVILAPAGIQLTTTQAPGTVLGPVKAIVKALDLAGADLPLDGQLVVAAPGQVPAATQQGCIGTAAPLATWVMVLSAAGQTLTVPTYLMSTAGTLLYGWGYARGPASYLAVTEYSGFLWASLCGWLVFQERVSSYTLAGAVLIVGGCLLAARSKVPEPPEIEVAA